MIIPHYNVLMGSQERSVDDDGDDDVDKEWGEEHFTEGSFLCVECQDCLVSTSQCPQTKDFVSTMIIMTKKLNMNTKKIL